MQSMSDDDAAYSALLAQLLSDPATTRDARVHSWIEHQYDFALSEQPVTTQFPFASSRPPSPSPSSSLGARRTCSIDRPDSPLLPRSSCDHPSSPRPSYDALFFPPSHSNSEDHLFEEQERVRALRFIVQEMAHWKSQESVPPSPQNSRDKGLPAPPPSPASSFTQSTSSRAMRSRSSSACISRLPSFTSTLSSEQSHPQEIAPPLPVSVIVHGEYQHDLVLRHEHAYLHKRDGSLPSHCQEQEGQYLCPVPDDKDSAEPSPTLSNFSCAYSRETSFTTPYTSSPASPVSAIFSCPPCSPEDIALPASPVDEQIFFRELPKTNVLPPSPAAPPSPVAMSAPDGALHRLRAPKSLEYSQSRWSIATTASLAPSNMESKPGTYSIPRTPPKEKKDKSLKTPKKRARFISLISRLSPGRADNATNGQTGDVEYDSANDSDAEEKEKSKQRKSLSKKSSLASLRASFSLSRASFSSQRPPMSSPIAEVPPLPTSPTISSPLAETFTSPLRPSLPKRPSRANLLNTPLPPIPQSASSISTFPSLSQLSISDSCATSPAESRLSLVCTNSTPNMSRISLLPSPRKRTSTASLVGAEYIVHSTPAPATARSKSIFRLTAKPKSLKMPTTSETSGAAMPSKLPIPGNTSLPSPVTAHSRIPQVPTKFIPPAKLATVIATQSRRVPALNAPGPASPTSKLPMPPSRTLPKVPRYITPVEKPLPEGLTSVAPSSKLPMSSSAKGLRVGTVRGFWKRQ